MANPEHLEILQQGVQAWNEWRQRNREILPDLSEVDLPRALFQGVDLSEVNLPRANLYGANLQQARLGGANLNDATLSGANLIGAKIGAAKLARARLVMANLSEAMLGAADLTGADLSEANLTAAVLFAAKLDGAKLARALLGEANLMNASLIDADLTEANLESAILVNAKLQGANLQRCRVFGISAWGVNLEGATQTNLVITPIYQPAVTVDNLEIAQFIYLLLTNQKIRSVIDTLTTKMVLILGRFTAERKQILDALREELRHRNYVPVLFDFDKPANRDVTETVTTLAHLSRFIIADLTDPRSIPQELTSIIPDSPSLPVQPIIQSSQREYGMFEHFERYPWVLPIVQYEKLDDLLTGLGDKVIAPAEQKAKELATR